LLLSVKLQDAAWSRNKTHDASLKHHNGLTVHSTSELLRASPFLRQKKTNTTARRAGVQTGPGRLRAKTDNPMNTILHLPTVLVLNRFWQAIHVKTPAEAFCMMASDGATGLDIAEGSFLPTRWSDWILLTVRECDQSVNTARGLVRVPTVVVAAKYARVPLRRPRFGARGIWERDGGVCQYTGRKLERHEGNVDHVLPRSRGGKTTWENCVLAHREVNSRKGDRLPHEAGLHLHRHPAAPRALPASVYIRNHHGVADWAHFLR
jgi:5-methylcytosine-specific restriction endonuclease McrA